MALKNHISYKWQIFIPVAVIIWSMTAGIVFWKYHDDRRIRLNQVDQLLMFINSRIISFYEKDIDSYEFLEFAYNFYTRNPNYDDIRTSIYVDNNLAQSLGEPIEIDTRNTNLIGTSYDTEGKHEPYTDNTDRKSKSYISNNLFYSVRTSDDGRVTVVSSIKIVGNYMTSVMLTRRTIFVVIGIAFLLTVIAYLIACRATRNIKVLRNIAQRANSDPSFIPSDNFSHDEIGDISRQIIEIYNERANAIKRLENEHEIAVNAINEKARSKRQLTNNINHELRTPIGVIKGYLDTIIDNPDIDEDSRHHFMLKAQEHVNRLSNLIADVTAISRLEESGEMINTTELDFHEIINSISSDFKVSGMLGDMQFRYDIPVNCKVLGNLNLLTGVLINLAKNAKSYSKGTLIEITKTGEDENFYEFTFRDNGVGVGEEHIPHLFERFYRIDSGRSRKAGGTGLGLPIVKSTIIVHGGTIRVENHKDGGLAFIFTLPKYRVGPNGKVIQPPSKRNTDKKN